MSFVLLAFSYSLVILIVDSNAASGWYCDPSGERVELKSLRKRHMISGLHCMSLVWDQDLMELSMLLLSAFDPGVVGAMNYSGRILLELVALC